MKERLDASRKDVTRLLESLHIDSSVQAEVAAILEDAKIEAAELKQLMKTDETQGPGMGLVKLGAALIAFPDPTVSDAVGVGLVAAGLVMNKVRDRPLTAQDVGRELRATLKEIEKLRSQISLK